MSVKAGDVVELTMEQVAFGGEGIGRCGNMVVFVPYTVDGDTARIEILECRKRYARGRLQEILQPSPHRTPPYCEDYIRCGGCCYQHIAYTHQLLLKETQVRDAFKRIGRIPSPPIRPVIASPEPYHYRLKADFHLRLQKGKAPALGLMSGASNRIVEIEQCKIVEESINQLSQDLRKKLLHGSWIPRRDRLTLWSTDNKGHSGGVNTEQLRATWITRTIKNRTLTVHRDGFFQANQY
ncbi:MAG TPA: TRAM domain-containing protein, partial [Syntrophales bacterium]|nr:TRAM domain-containing protein [Syntrophales bacterium]